MKPITVAALLLLVQIDSAWSQGIPPTLRYFCLFEKVASPDGLEKANDFKLEYILETASGKGMVVGNQGFSKVIVINGPYAITFLEPLGTGVVQSTTITQNGMAVHSRHTALDDTELLPSQYYGSCVVRASAPFVGK